MRTFGLRQRLCGSAAVLAISAAGLIAVPAYAQTADEDRADSGDIVVTAQRREEKARDVPITLTTITAETLGQGDVQQLSDIAKLTPALRFDNYGGFAQPTIRGVGTALAASGAGSNVGIYVDGFYAPNPLSADFQLLSVESVTVLKGPQGTLFGRNSTGGAIQVTTSDPSHDARGLAEVSYGRFNSQKYQAYVTGGLSDTIAVDLAGLYRKGNGYIRNITTGNARDGAYEAWSVRAGVKLDVSDSASFLLRYTHADTKDPNANTTNAYVDDAGRVYSFGAVLPPAFGVKTATDPREVSGNGRTDFTSKVDAFQLTGEFDLGFATLTSYTQFRDESSYSALDLDGTSLPVFDVEFFITDKIFTQEFVLASQGEGRLKWSAGAFFFSDKNKFHYLNGSIQGAPMARISSTGTDTTGIAVFADASYELANKLFLGVGGRYGHDKITNGFFDTTVLAGTPTTGRTNVPEVSRGNFSPRVTLRYQPTPSSSIFASFSRGYKAPILNVNGYATNAINAEHISAFEVGYKYAARGLSFDASAYYYKYNDLQVASYIGTQSLLTNAADSRVYGVEAQFGYEVTPNFSFNLAGAYLDAKYDRFQGSPFYAQCLDPVLSARIDREIGPDNCVVIISTSGSTAKPKGVMFSHRTMLAYAQASVMEDSALSDGGGVIVVAPLATSAGMVQLVHYTVLGCTLYFEPAFVAERFLEILERQKIVSFAGAPAFFERIAALPGFAQADLSALRMVSVGGARVTRALFDAWAAKGLIIRQTYGQTEAGGNSTVMPQRFAAEFPEKCGWGGIFTHHRIVDRTGRDVPPDTEGEILIRGPGMMLGYWNNPQATAETIRDGWLHTGDIGKMDERGLITFVDRVKDIIVSGGLNISAAEVERAVLEYPGIAEVAVIAAHDPKFQETPLAVVHADGPVDVAALIAHCNARLADFKVPRYVAVRDEPLPRLATQKISKPALRDEYRNAHLTLPRVR